MLGKIFKGIGDVLITTGNAVAEIGKANSVEEGIGKTFTGLGKIANTTFGAAQDIVTTGYKEAKHIVDAAKKEEKKGEQ